MEVASVLATFSRPRRFPGLLRATAVSILVDHGRSNGSLFLRHLQLAPTRRFHVSHLPKSVFPHFLEPGNLCFPVWKERGYGSLLFGVWVCGWFFWCVFRVLWVVSGVS